MTIIRRVVLGSLVLCAVAGCSRFQKEWDSASATPHAGEPMLGRWSGTWKSEATGHTDKLDAVVKLIDWQHGGTKNLEGAKEGDTHYAWFHAHYLTIITFNAEVPLKAQRDGDRETFTGEKD